MQIPKVTQFRDIIKTLSPPWLATGVAEKYMYTIGLGVDLLCEKLNEGMRARMPGLGNVTANYYLGRDRNLTQGANETAAAFVLRLQGAVAENKFAGLPQTVLEQILTYFIPTTFPVRMVSASSVWDQILSGVWSKFYGAGNWDWDGLPAKHWRSWVILDMSGNVPWQQDGTWSDPGTWDDGGTWDTTALPADVEQIRALVRLWKSGATVVKNILVTFDFSYFRPQYTADGTHNPDGTFGRWSIGSGGSGGPGIASRFPDVSYWDGTT